MLPQNRETDHAIPIVEGKEPPFGPLYNLSQRELKVLQEYIEDALQKGWIQHSTSPAGSPILFVPKKDGTLRLCVDYRGLNAVTIKDRCPLPLIEETLDRMQGSRYYTSLDLKDAYNRIRIKPGDEWKTAFRTRYGHFEYLVMPFGLTNAPATFQAYINRTLRGLVDHICVVYLDDILIYTHDESVETHWRAVCAVLDRLRRAELFVNLKKCAFLTKEVAFLGFIITTTGVRADPARIESITSWPAPTNVRELQSFLGFTNFYRRFIIGYAGVTAPMTALLKKDTEFQWTPQANEAFLLLKARFTSAPLMRHFDETRAIRLETDASAFAVAGIMSQQFEDGQWHPIAYASRKLQEAERNYEVYDQELLAIVYCFKQWRHYLEGAQHTIQVYTDHNNLRGISDVHKLNPRQARWATYLAGFDFEVSYRTGKSNPADGPSRRADYYTENTVLSTLLPTLQRKLKLASELKVTTESRTLIARVETASRASGSTPELSSVVAGETPVDSECDAGSAQNPVTGAMECMSCVPRSLAKVLLASEPALSREAPLLDVLSALQQKDAFAVQRIAELSQEERSIDRSRAQTDGQTERQNQTLEHYLRVFVSQEQNDWASLLKTAEFAYNNSVQSSTKETPFYIVLGKHPLLTQLPEDMQHEGEVPAATDKLKRMQDARKKLEDNLRSAQEAQQKYYNRKHLQHSFQKGDMVLLSTRNLPLKLPSRKLAAKFIGPFAVQDAVGSQAYRIRLPPTYQVHNVFHVSLLKPYQERPGSKEDNTQAPELSSTGEEVWEVEEILADRTRKGQKEYLLRWAGYDSSWDSWAPASDFEDMGQLLTAYEQRTQGARPKQRGRPRKT
ncbi:hypothetical protein MBLNU459_g0793t2 [Dothideomycetes sp. NU459]